MGRWIEDYFRQLFDNRVVDEMLRQKLWKHYYDILAGGVDKGFSNFGNLTIDSSELVASLKMDIARFSAFKEESFKNELLKQLQGKELPTWTDFKESAAKVDAEYNQRHLQTEYHQTVANAQAAAQWKDYESRKHLYPNLRYQAVMDGRTRETHARWNGLVLPLEHDFWKTNYPPNDWGCRCSVVQVDDEVDDSKLAQTGNSLTKAAFQNNPGISGKVFDGKHPYYNVSETDKKQVESNLEKFSTPKFTPKKLGKYEEKLNIKINKDIFNYIDKPTSLRFINPKEYKNSTGAYYLTDKNLVIIPIDARRKLSKWKAESVVYHEFGHAADWHHGLKKRNEVASLMDRFRKELDFKKIDQRLEDLGSWAFDNQKWDLMEKVGAAHDTLMSLNPAYGRGHRPSYWEDEGNKEAEFIAHAFENKFAGNEVFKKVMPELYEETIKMIDKIKPTQGR